MLRSYLYIIDKISKRPPAEKKSELKHSEIELMSIEGPQSEEEPQKAAKLAEFEMINAMSEKGLRNTAKLAEAEDKEDINRIENEFNEQYSFLRNSSDSLGIDPSTSKAIMIANIHLNRLLTMNNVSYPADVYVAIGSKLQNLLPAMSYFQHKIDYVMTPLMNINYFEQKYNLLMAMDESEEKVNHIIAFKNFLEQIQSLCHRYEYSLGEPIKHRDGYSLGEPIKHRSLPTDFEKKLTDYLNGCIHYMSNHLDPIRPKFGI